MSITGMTFNEFCRDVAEQGREDRAARRRLLKMMRAERIQAPPRASEGTSSLDSPAPTPMEGRP